METLSKLLREEESPAVRAVLGHFVFVFMALAAQQAIPCNRLQLTQPSPSAAINSLGVRDVNSSQ
jgi:hypothetical protein